MSNRTYDINLSCGCMISLDGGGGLIPCSYTDDSECKYHEEFLCNEQFPEWMQEQYHRNNPGASQEELDAIRAQAQEDLQERLEEDE